MILCSEGVPMPQISPFTPGHISGPGHKTPNFGTGTCLLPKEGEAGKGRRLAPNGEE